MREYAQAHNVDLTQSTVVADGKGARFVSDKGGDFALFYPVAASSPQARTSATMAAGGLSYGACTGSFHGPMKINNNVEWGGQSSCTSTNPNDLYVHRLEARLRSTCAGAWPFCGVYSDVRGPIWSPDSPYNRVATAIGLDHCTTGTNYRYVNSIYVTVHSVKYGPFENPGGVVLPCNVNPD
ncbi:hypothetical protein BGP79_15660 [Tersicoccus sp. Bi-70]|nr:hypothetical protein BGP79_15660 [Tersicoccus sp. Bi-70]